MFGRPMKSIPTPLLKLLRWVALALAFGCTVAVLAGQGGRWNYGLDVLNHFEPIWLAGSILALAFWLAAGRPGRRIPILAGVAGIVAVLQMAPELLARRNLVSPSPQAETLKIIQFNVWSRNIDGPGTLKWILAQNADVVVLEEALGDPVIAHSLQRIYPYRRTCDGVSYCEIEMFSKARPIAWAGLLDPAGLPGAWAAYDGAGGPFVVVGVHAPWPVPAGPQQFTSMVLAKIMASLPKDRMIVAGDFNSTPWSFSLRRQDQLFGLERRTRGLASWPARAYHLFKLDPPFPILPIDQVYAGKGWRTVSVTRGPPLGSDHYPVVAVFQAAR